MIIDTTYLLPLVGIDIGMDVSIIIDKIGMDDIIINSISLFELQAKAVKLGIKTDEIYDTINTIIDVLNIRHFYEKHIIATSSELKKMINDYIDCVILATAITENDDLLTEDSLILENNKIINDRYGIKVYNFKSLL